MTEHGNKDINPEYRYCDWYIDGKYQSVKEEVLNENNKVKLTKD